jgi:hypothetical protein
VSDPDPEKRALAYYAASVALIVHAETASQRRTASYLIASGLIFAAWPQVRDLAPAGLLLAVCGLVLSVISLFLQIRTRAFVDSYVNTAKELEGDNLGPVKKAHLPGMPLGRIASIAIPLLGVISFSVLAGISLTAEHQAASLTPSRATRQSIRSTAPEAPAALPTSSTGTP